MSGLTLLKAIECGIGLADKDPNCRLCNVRVRVGACPEHAAVNVLRILREEGYVQEAETPHVIKEARLISIGIVTDPPDPHTRFDAQETKL